MRKTILSLFMLIVFVCICSCGQSNDGSKLDQTGNDPLEKTDTADTSKSSEYLLLRKSSYNAEGNLSGCVAEYDYDSEGKETGYSEAIYEPVVSLTEPLIQYYGKWEYDDRGLQVKLVFDDGAYNEYEYDKDGNPTYRRNYDANGCLTSEDVYSYDMYGEVVEHTIVYGGSSIKTTLKYERDDSGRIIRCIEYDEWGKPSDSWTYEYDEFGNLIRKTSSDGGWTEYEYISKKDLSNGDTASSLLEDANNSSAGDISDSEIDAIAASLELNILPDDHNRGDAERIILAYALQNNIEWGYLGRCDCENDNLKQGYAFSILDENRNAKTDQFYYVVPFSNSVYCCQVRSEFWLVWKDGYPYQMDHALKFVSLLIGKEAVEIGAAGDRYDIICGGYEFLVSWDCSTVWVYADEFNCYEIYPTDTIGFFVDKSAADEQKSSQLQSTGYSAYDQKIQEYYDAASDINLFYQKYCGDDSSINSLILGYYHSYSGTKILYAMYDVDGNGVPELLFSDGYNLIDIYGLYNGERVKLFEECYFGDRSRLHILSDGRLVTEGSSGASSSECEFYVIGEDGVSLSTTEAYYYNGDGNLSYMDETHTYLLLEEYCDIADIWLENAVFSELHWELIASN